MLSAGWLRALGCRRMVGPMTELSPVDLVGFLVGGVLAGLIARALSLVSGLIYRRGV